MLFTVILEYVFKNSTECSVGSIVVINIAAFQGLNRKAGISIVVAIGGVSFL